MVWIRFFCITTVKYREFYLIKIYICSDKKKQFQTFKKYLTSYKMSSLNIHKKKFKMETIHSYALRCFTRL